MNTKANILVIVATYNERENLPSLVDAIQTQLPLADLLIVDDNSPDGTGAWCDERAQTDSRFSVLHRAGKLGLGSATVDGFRYALEREYEFVATMDADFSHAPESLPVLVGCLIDNETGAVNDCGVAGVAIGSRYIKGGAIEGWPLTRHLASRTVNLFARLLLGLKTKDNSGAFRVYRRSTLETIDIDQIQCDGFGYLEEILWRIQRKNIPIVESPITFVDREAGRSKTSFSMGIGVFWHLIKIATGRIK